MRLPVIDFAFVVVVVVFFLNIPFLFTVNAYCHQGRSIVSCQPTNTRPERMSCVKLAPRDICHLLKLGKKKIVEILGSVYFPQIVSR